MDYAFPEKYIKVSQFFDHEFGDIEVSTQLDDKEKLVFYALRQQAEHGPCTGGAPSIWWTRERLKYAAWKQLGDMSKYEAMVNFVKILEERLGGSVNWVEKCGTLEHSTDAGIKSVTTLHGGDKTHASVVDTWDDDLRAYSEPTEQNVHYLASQVMQLRRELHHLRLSNAEQSTCNSVALCLAQPPIKAVANNKVNSRQVVLLPPEPHTAKRNTSPPALHCSPTRMTEAALKSSRLTSPTTRKREMGWAEWLGLN
ncbi:hypothetical protein TraAM80_00236 [Trypanosoma rangeli]|uniref:ACB domain-containing protein n=1 Tax=Trypanosoma rangeli TaxID=5698 RepID=A0A422P468_TRYRA|nr:uncharacterized protein TraAM80_00236 [Trypanosoma rangeli]RNF12520.1 hypothetical protein TraAM80_00236 [Trypanosoma rangeli]|eukprot:RNF12520.1 hypothetical protein TraAM80_00236 [Trypanosoma rangeli]